MPTQDPIDYKTLYIKLFNSLSALMVEQREIIRKIEYIQKECEYIAMGPEEDFSPWAPLD